MNPAEIRYEEYIGDLWLCHTQMSTLSPRPRRPVLSVTTNGIVRRDGQLVMGAGIALTFAKRYPGLATMLGNHVRIHGNTPTLVKIPTLSATVSTSVLSLPTKNHWKDPSSVDLVIKSMNRASELAKSSGFDCIVSTRPGCGLGTLSWEADVRPNLVRLTHPEMWVFAHQERGGPVLGIYPLLRVKPSSRLDPSKPTDGTPYWYITIGGKDVTHLTDIELFWELTYVDKNKGTEREYLVREAKYRGMDPDNIKPWSVIETLGSGIPSKRSAPYKAANKPEMPDFSVPFQGDEEL